MALNLNSLRLFLAVATHRGFSRAARMTGVSQPAISKAVRLLEQQTGAQLFQFRPDVAPPPMEKKEKEEK